MMPDASGAGGVSEYWRIASDAGKTRLTNFEFSWTDLTTWSIIASVAVTGIGGTFSDQLMMQRYFSAGGTRAVVKSFWTSMAISMPTVLILYLIGILLFGFYGSGRHAIPDAVRGNGDKVLPFFVSTQLPVGLKGLVISAIVAATLSTVSSVLNSLCTATITDFYLRLRKPKLPVRGFEVVVEDQPDTALANDDAADDRSNVALSRFITVGWGALGTVLACYVDRLGMIIDQTNTLFGLIGGGLGGIFMLGLFTRRANANGTIVGAVAGTLATWSVMEWTNVHYMWYAVVGTSTTLIVGYGASLILPAPSRARAAVGEMENDESIRGESDLLGSDPVRSNPVSPGR
jgi:Na+/proline symporter